MAAYFSFTLDHFFENDFNVFTHFLLFQCKPNKVHPYYLSPLDDILQPLYILESLYVLEPLYVFEPLNNLKPLHHFNFPNNLKPLHDFYSPYNFKSLHDLNPPYNFNSLYDFTFPSAHNQLAFYPNFDPKSHEIDAHNHAHSLNHERPMAHKH